MSTIPSLGQYLKLYGGLGETLRYLTPGKPTVFPILPPRET